VIGTRKGQWIGPYAGTIAGEFILELDEVGGHLVGNATIFPSDPALPATFVNVVLLPGTLSHSQRYQVFPIEWQTGEPAKWEQIANRYPGVTMSTYADTQWLLSGKTLYVSWTTDIGNHGLAILTQGVPDAPSGVVPLRIDNWVQFTKFASGLQPHRYIFRGHSDNRWRLRTYFHRTGRADLRRFMYIDIPTLHRNLSGLTQHFFNLSNPVENGAFYTLVQHHGYPTPLLDWTYSAYVAAYFAYRTLPKEKRREDHKVRILIFDAEQWRQDYLQLQKIIPAPRHFSLFTPLAIDNPRMVPQQALLTISNVDDIEGYVAEREALKGRAYLQVIDLPGSERRHVLQQLSMMGITAGSLFPGFDGACEQLREQLFDL
jgi:hypothetical protein